MDELRVITLCDGPPPVLPEASVTILLPISGMAIAGVVLRGGIGYQPNQSPHFAPVGAPSTDSPPRYPTRSCRAPSASATGWQRDAR